MADTRRLGRRGRKPVASSSLASRTDHNSRGGIDAGFASPAAPARPNVPSRCQNAGLVGLALPHGGDRLPGGSRTLDQKQAGYRCEETPVPRAPLPVRATALCALCDWETTVIVLSMKGVALAPVVHRRIRMLHARGLSSYEVARRLGIPRTTVWNSIHRPPHRRLRTAWYAEVPRPRPGTRRGNLYAYVLGMYLGDGCIDRAGGSFRLVLYLDARQPRVLHDSRVALTTLVPTRRVGTVRRAGNCVALSVYYKAWEDLIPQHGPGKKSQRRISLRPWQRRIVARHAKAFLKGLLDSDGCRFIHRDKRGGYAYVRYSFDNESADIRELFMQTCRRVGIHYTRPRERTVAVNRQADVRALEALCGPK